MKTSKTIFCFGVVQGNKFAEESFIYPINYMMQSKSEVVEHPDICVTPGDFKDLNCFELNLNDFDLLYEALLTQSRLLEKLFIDSIKTFV